VAKEEEDFALVQAFRLITIQEKTFVWEKPIAAWRILNPAEILCGDSTSSEDILPSSFSYLSDFSYSER
jgi:hypothetical protein